MSKTKIIGNTVGTTLNPKKIGDYLDPAKSAYDIARDKGFEGTEEEWLASLNGKTAYEYAADAGYTGTEEEFAEKLAADNVTEVADEVSSGNMLPVTSNAVAQTVGNIEILLSTI